MILHIAERACWEASDPATGYAPERFADEGFVHCSDPQQAEVVANRLFRGRRDLVLLLIDEGRLRVTVQRENLEGGSELFPHVYGPIDRAAVVAVRDLVPDDRGGFLIPMDVIEVRG